MNEPKPFASLSSSLLARKGSARPAMRPQLAPLHQFQGTAARQVEDDLGWNDMGDTNFAPDFSPNFGPDVAAPSECTPPLGLTPSADFTARVNPMLPRDQQDEPAQVVQFKPHGFTAMPESTDVVHDREEVAVERPDVLRQQEEVAARISTPAPTPTPVRKRRNRRSSQSEGRRVAFTLRLDQERHLQLRLACTLKGCSAQQLVTDAIDKLISELPDVSAVAAKVSEGRN